MTANIARWINDRSAAQPDLPAIKQGDVVLTNAALDGAVGRCATLLADHGVGAGDHVALTMPNVAYFPVVYYAALRLGAVVVPMNPLLKSREIAYTWTDSEAKVAVVFALFAEEAQKAAAETGVDLIVVVPGEFDQTLAGLQPVTEVADRGIEDTAVILYTSGTTGQPKGAELTHGNIGSNVVTTVETLLPNGPGDMIFGGLPLFHSFGQTCALNAAMYGGGALTLLPRFDPEQALQIVADDKVTMFLGVPTMYMALLGVKDPERFDTSTLKIGASGGASLPVEVLRGVEQRFGFRLLEGYGLSETSPVASFNHPDVPSKPGSIGTPIRGCEFSLRDLDDAEITASDEIGEICIRGENVMKGYWKKPDATEEAMRGGWFHSGDLAMRDDDGFYFIKDRKKDMILRNGFNVYPREVEELLYTHPDVAEAAVFGVPHAEHGEEIAAKVTLKEGGTVTADELREWVKGQIAAYKYPRIVQFGILPKGPTGKILKREITLE